MCQGDMMPIFGGKRSSKFNKPQSLRGEGGIDLSSVIASSDSTASWTANTSLSLISISMGFTVALYNTGKVAGQGMRREFDESCKDETPSQRRGEGWGD